MHAGDSYERRQAGRRVGKLAGVSRVRGNELVERHTLPVRPMNLLAQPRTYP